MEKRYLSGWHYNAACILDELEKLVIANGGELVSTWENEKRHTYEIHRRSISSEFEDYTCVHHADFLYTRFVLDGCCYYYQFSINPFFDFMYEKSVVRGGSVYGRRYLDADLKEWLGNPYKLEYNIDEAANSIFTMLKNAPQSIVYDNNYYQKLYPISY